jgi:glycosyltransferase involved in cell wall biosynthesis
LSLFPNYDRIESSVMDTRKVLFITDRTECDERCLSQCSLISRLDREEFKPIFLGMAEGPLSVRIRESGVETAAAEINPDYFHLRENDFLKPQKFFDMLKLAPVTGKLVGFIREHSPDVVCTMSAMTHLIGAAAGRLAGAKVVWRFSDIYRPPLRFIFSGTALWGADRVVCNSRFTARQFGGLKKPNVIYDGIDLSGIKVEKGCNTTRETILKLPPEARVIGTVFTHPLKRVSMPAAEAEEESASMLYLTFLQAAEKVCSQKQDAYFVIAGDFEGGNGDDRDELYAWITEMGIGHRVSLANIGADRHDIINSLDLFVWTSREETTEAGDLLEAMALGKGAVANNEGIGRELIKNGESGVCIPPGSPDRLADILIDLLDNTEVAETLGANARERVRDRFDLKTQIRNFEEILRGL